MKPTSEQSADSPLGLVVRRGMGAAASAQTDDDLLNLTRGMMSEVALSPAPSSGPTREDNPLADAELLARLRLRRRLIMLGEQSSIEARARVLFLRSKRHACPPLSRPL